MPPNDHSPDCPRALAASAAIAMTPQPAHLLSVEDYRPDQITGLIAAAASLKARPRQPLLDGINAALAFEKPSLRTRVSFDVGLRQLGGHGIYLNQQQIGVDSREPVQDIARVLSRMVDLIVFRTHSHTWLERMATAASVPVINALSDEEHPCQALADLLTLHEVFGSIAGRRLAYIGDGNNVAASLALACASSGMHFTIACPDGYEIAAGAWHAAQERAGDTGANLERVRLPADAVARADALYTDVWTSMGQESERDTRADAFAGYVIDEALMAAAPTHAVVLHDLPAHRGEEISGEVLERFANVIFTQAENRLHMQKAIMVDLLARRGVVDGMVESAAR